MAWGCCLQFSDNSADFVIFDVDVYASIPQHGGDLGGIGMAEDLFSIENEVLQPFAAFLWIRD